MVVGALAVVQWLTTLAFALTVRHNGWLLYQGGDQAWLMTTGWLLGGGELAPTYISYGWPLVLAPIMRLAGPSFITAMPPVIALNVLVLGPLALWAIYGLGARIAGRAFGLLAAAVWVVLPFAVIPLWRGDYHDRYVEQFLPGALGLTGLVDFQSMVLLLVGALLFMRALETRATLDSIAAGLVVGFAIGVKPSNGLFVAAPIVAALLARNLRPLLPFGLALLPALLTLALWKQRGLGTLPAFALEESRLAAGAIVAGIPGSTSTSISTGRTCTTTSTTCASSSGARACSSSPRSPAPSVWRAARCRWQACSQPGSAWSSSSKARRSSRPCPPAASSGFLMPGFPAYFLLAVSILAARADARRVPPAHLAAGACTARSTAGS